jgi:hypothetical protein
MPDNQKYKFFFMLSEAVQRRIRNIFFQGIGWVSQHSQKFNVKNVFPFGIIPDRFAYKSYQLLENSSFFVG